MNMTANMPNETSPGADPAPGASNSAAMPENPAPRTGVLAGIVSLKCPECRTGKVFANKFLKMHPTCPVCSLKFEREPGYFLGAMYFSYAMAIPPLTILTLLQKWRSPERSMSSCIIVAAIVFMPLVIPIVRYSRVIWLYFDRFFDPQDRQTPTSTTNPN